MDNNSTNFKNLSFLKKISHIFFLIEIIILNTFIFAMKNILFLFRNKRRTPEIIYLDKKIRENVSSIEILKEDDFNEVQIKSNTEINAEINKNLHRIKNISNVDTFFYGLITFPIFGYCFKYILNFPFLHKFKISIFKIADTYLKLGKLFFIEGLYEQSTIYLKKSLNFDKNNSDAHYWIGKSIYFQAAYISTIDPGNLTQCIVKINKYKKSLFNFKKALKNTNNEKIFKEIANVSFWLRNYKQSKKYCEIILKINPESYYAYKRISDIYFILNQKNKSEEFNKKAYLIKIRNDAKKSNTTIMTIPNQNNDNYYDIYNLGKQYQIILDGLDRVSSIKENDVEESIKQFQKIISVFLKEVDYYIYKAYAYKNNGFEKLAKECLRMALDVLYNNLSFIEYSNYDLKEYLKNYTPIKSIGKRINAIYTCF